MTSSKHRPVEVRNSSSPRKHHNHGDGANSGGAGNSRAVRTYSEATLPACKDDDVMSEDSGALSRSDNIKESRLSTAFEDPLDSMSKSAPALESKFTSADINPEGGIERLSELSKAPLRGSEMERAGWVQQEAAVAEQPEKTKQIDLLKEVEEQVASEPMLVRKRTVDFTDDDDTMTSLVPRVMGRLDSQSSAMGLEWLFDDTDSTSNYFLNLFIQTLYSSCLFCVAVSAYASTCTESSNTTTTEVDGAVSGITRQ